MANLVIPSEKQPLGFVVIDGKKVPVYIDPTWLKALQEQQRIVNAGIP